jgi:hypothetical protein
MTVITSREHASRLQRTRGLPFELVVSKLRRPSVRPGTVRRSPLIEVLARGDLRPVASVVAPAGTPRPIIDRLNQVLMAFINRPDIQDKMNALAITPWTSTPDELAQFIPAEIEKWAQVVKDAGITPE